MNRSALAPRGGRRSTLWHEMIAGADETAPMRPGRYLETPQRFGILPTLHFWNRRDVWRSARWILAPVTGLSALGTALLSASLSPEVVPLAAAACGLPVILTHGLLERWVRRRLRAGRG
jgi:hypothetical protein